MALYFYNTRILKDKYQQIAILKAQKNIDMVVKELPQFKNFPTPKAFWDGCQDKENIHNILVSRLNLGFWITILQNNIFFNNTYGSNTDFAKAMFPKLEKKIRRDKKEFFYFLSRQKKMPKKIYNTTPSEKAIILVSFLSGIRNRLNHCEILFKRNNEPSITTKLNGIEVYLECRKNRILKLLVNILENFL